VGPEDFAVPIIASMDGEDSNRDWEEAVAGVIAICFGPQGSPVG